MRRCTRFTAGFTLVEMAMVMVIIGLVIGGGLLTAVPVLRGSQSEATKKKMETVEQALMAYMMQNSCLPCPAAYAGTGTAAWDTLVSGCDTGDCASLDGVVPWVTLGISRSDAADTWGNRIRYGVTSQLVVSGSMQRNGTNYGNPGTLTVRDGGGTTVTTAAAYVLVSHGANGGFGYNAASGAQKTGDATHTNEAENNDADTTYIQDDVTGAEGANFFDDVVVWKSKPVLIQLCGAGACGNPS